MSEKIVGDKKGEMQDSSTVIPYLASGFDGFTDCPARGFTMKDVSNELFLSCVHDETTQSVRERNGRL